MMKKIYVYISILGIVSIVILSIGLYILFNNNNPPTGWDYTFDGIWSSSDDSTIVFNEESSIRGLIQMNTSFFNNETPPNDEEFYEYLYEIPAGDYSHIQGILFITIPDQNDSFTLDILWIDSHTIDITDGIITTRFTRI
jgi:hypothetical protein